jgi:hypothetical protein
MKDYIPFLKLKGSEISALRDLSKKFKNDNFIAFFDFPRKKPSKSRREDAPLPKTKEELFANDIIKLKRRFDINLKFLSEFYLDNYDLDDSINHNGKYNYNSIIKEFGPCGMIPVMGLDRHAEHLKSILSGLKSGYINNNRIALRLTKDDFESFKFSKKDIVEVIKEVENKFQNIDLVFDCRFCSPGSNAEYSLSISKFYKDAINDGFNFSRIIISGSSIPSSITEIVKPRTEKIILREELIIYKSIKKYFADFKGFYLGDYTCVSPEYSDVELFDEDMDSVTTAKLIYPYDDSVYVLRGGRFKGDRGQMKDLASKLVAKTHVFRGEKYSSGDRYIYEKSMGVGKSATASTIVSPLINLHLTYMLNK